jgi:hypothetical protein
MTEPWTYAILAWSLAGLTLFAGACYVSYRAGRDKRREWRRRRT